MFYETTGVPVHSVLLCETRDEALGYPKGSVRLAFCPDCGFSSNIDFKPELHEYSQRYEETQGFSPTFRAFHECLAQSLIDRYDLRGKSVLEIGCGKGEFLLLLCERGGNRGLGFDPAYVEGRLPIPDELEIRFIKNFYSEKYSDISAEFVCCKMTLEHIPDTSRFIAMVRRALGEEGRPLVFFQVPDAERIWRDAAFWDVYYEHCSYFSGPALEILFRQCDFEVLEVSREYDNQYLTVLAQPTSGGAGTRDMVEGLNELGPLTASFTDRVQATVDALGRKVAETAARGGKTVIWGGGSKAVSFLSALGQEHNIEFVVDINPYRQGTFLAGGGQQIVSPDFLPGYGPDLVILMNSIYRDEVKDSLNERGLSPTIEAL